MSNAESPANRRPKIHGYIATSEPLEINEVIPIGNHRAFVVYQFADFYEWEAARTHPGRVSEPKEFGPGFVKFQRRVDKHPVRSVPAAPPTTGYFYGVQWLPEERTSN